MAVHSILVDMGLSKWAVEDRLAQESFPQKEGEWGVIEYTSPYPVGTLHYGIPPVVSPLQGLSFTYKHYKHGEVTESRLLSQEGLEEVRARLQTELAAERKSYD